MNVWEDVRFDHAACRAAIDELEATAAVVAESAEVRRREAVVAVATWRGPHRDRFDRDLAVTLRRATDLATRLRRTAARLRDARAEATAEQARRERRRDEIRRAREEAARCAPLRGAC